MSSTTSAHTMFFLVNQSQTLISIMIPEHLNQTNRSIPTKPKVSKNINSTSWTSTVATDDHMKTRYIVHDVVYLTLLICVVLFLLIVIYRRCKEVGSYDIVDDTDSEHGLPTYKQWWNRLVLALTMELWNINNNNNNLSKY